MAHLGGGAEAHACFKPYEYGAMSSLVLTTDSRQRGTHESAGKLETLWGTIDRVYRGKPSEKLKKSKNKKERDASASAVVTPEERKSKRRKIKEESMLMMAEDGGVYQLKTKETRAAYETLLSVMQRQFGAQPWDVLIGAADAVLVVLKKEIERILNPITNQLVD